MNVYSLAARVVWAVGVTVSVIHAQDSTAPNVGTFRAGGFSFAIPAPNSELVETGSDYRVLFEPLTPNSNRLIAVFLTPEDLATLQTGKVPLSKQYGMVQISRRIEFVDVNDEMYEQIRVGLDQQFQGELENHLKSSVDELNQKEKAITGKEGDIKIDKPTPLGRFFTKTNAEGYGMILPVSGNGVSVQRAMGLAIAKVNRRLLFLYYYIDYKDEDTIKQLRARLESWVDAVLKAN